MVSKQLDQVIHLRRPEPALQYVRRLAGPYIAVLQAINSSKCFSILNVCFVVAQQLDQVTMLIFPAHEYWYGSTLHVVLVLDTWTPPPHCCPKLNEWRSVKTSIVAACVQVK